MSIAVIGTGIAGMAAAWLLSRRHEVTVYETEPRIGGHSHTVEMPGPDGMLPVDTGFIVYNEVTYPNLTALFRHLEVPTQDSNMSFAVSLDGGRLEYAGDNLATLFAQKRNLVNPRFWAMLRDLRRFYRTAPALLAEPGADEISLGQYLAREGYGRPFIEDHLLPMAAAIWSAPSATLSDHPAVAFIRFCTNHGLLSFRDRPTWRTVSGGSREYVRRLTQPYADRILTGCGVRRLQRTPEGVLVEDARGSRRRFDQVVIAAHADEALAMLGDADAEEKQLLGAFHYECNEAVLHQDAALMPRRRAVWASWNYLGRRGVDALSVTYWMNRLQSIPAEVPAFLTLNPTQPPREARVLRRMTYHHPIFDLAAVAAQRRLWQLQGRRGTWFCGAYFGAGFHEDGLQAGLAVAEQLGGVQRPWTVADPSGRIHVGAPGRRPQPVAEPA